jgi:ribosomal protein S18 acetylase RimI-like enzyme
MPEPLIRRITVKDIPAAAPVLAHAFLSDPYSTYTLRDPKKRPHQLYLLMTVVLRYSCLYGEVYATPRMEAVAAWLPPDVGRESYWHMLRAGALPVIWQCGPSVIRTYLQVEALAHELHMRHASQPHWYLSQLGVEPMYQGQGYGRRILNPTLEAIDRNSKDVYLETLNPSAIPFYEKLGFKVCEEVNLPGGGPPMWAMLRHQQPG